MLDGYGFVIHQHHYVQCTMYPNDVANDVVNILRVVTWLGFPKYSLLLCSKYHIIVQISA